MENYIMGNFRQTIFASDKGYIIGLLKVKNTDIDSMKEYINKSFKHKLSASSACSASSTIPLSFLSYTAFSISHHQSFTKNDLGQFLSVIVTVCQAGTVQGGVSTTSTVGLTQSSQR